MSHGKIHRGKFEDCDRCKQEEIRRNIEIRQLFSPVKQPIIPTTNKELIADAAKYVIQTSRVVYNDSTKPDYRQQILDRAAAKNRK